MMNQIEVTEKMLDRMIDMVKIMENLANGQVVLAKMVLTLAEKSKNHDEGLKKMAMQIEGNNETVEALAASKFRKQQN